MSFNNNMAAVQVLQRSRVSPQSSDTNESHNRKRKLHYDETWHCGKQHCRVFGLVRCDKKLHSNQCVFTGLWKSVSWAFLCQRCVGSHLKRCAFSILSQKGKRPTRKDLLALLYLWCSPNSNKPLPSHVKVLSGAARASWWQRSRCLRRSTKAHFDIWDDKETHSQFRSSNRRFKIVLSAQTWCSALNQDLWRRLYPVGLVPNPLRPSSSGSAHNVHC